MEITISLGQMDVTVGQPEVNLARAQAMTAEAARRGSDLVVFPELWATGYDLENAERHATALDKGVFAQVGELARANNIAIVGSCLSLLAAGSFGNTAVLHAADGTLMADYSKVHLFRLMAEDQYLTAGEELAMTEVAGNRAGLAICYDLRFPEIFRHYALSGARMVLLPAEWPNPRLAHWRTLLRARAIENQIYMIACNRVGRSGETTFFGHSCIIDPWGNIVIEGGEAEMLLTATIEMSLVDDIRASIPVFADRRPELYGASPEVA